MKARQAPIYKGITAQGPNKLNRHGKPLKPKKRRKKGSAKMRKHNSKRKKLLSIKDNSKLRNQLASLRQSSRPVVDVGHNHNHNKKRKNNGLVQSLQWDKLKSSPFSFAKLTKRSLLFSIEELSKIDKVTIYYIGKSGLQQLIELNPTKFSRYKSTLFDEKKILNSAKTGFDRSSISLKSSELEFIDNEIISLLRDLSDYFLFEECHKVLEFLISHYKIHLNYPLYCLECSFPYYTTITFTRFIQLIEFNTHKWQLLFLNSQKTLMPLNKNILIRQCLKDYSILKFIQEMYQNNKSSKVTKKFYIEIMLNILNANFNKSNMANKSNKLLLQIIPFISTKNIYDHLIILNFIASKIKFTQSQIQQILLIIIKALNINKPKVNERLLLTFDYLLTSQNIKHLSDDLMDQFLSFNNDILIQTLIAIKFKFNINFPIIITKQFITNYEKIQNDSNKLSFLKELLIHFDFNLKNKTIICNLILQSKFVLSLYEIIKTSNNDKYIKTLNQCLWKNKNKNIDNKSIKQLIDIFIENDNLQIVLESSLKYKNKEITNCIIEKIQHQIKHINVYNNQQIADLLMICLKNSFNHRIMDNAFNILFENKTLLIDANNTSQTIESLLSILKSNDINTLWNRDDEMTCNLFEFLCFNMKIIENDNDNLKNKKLMKLINCNLIDILSNIPICNDKQKYVESLLKILENYSSAKILISCSTINIDNVLNKIGENMMNHYNEYLELMPNLSIQSKCLLLLCLKQVINTDNNQKIMNMLLFISNNLRNDIDQVSMLICNVFNECMESNDGNNDDAISQILESLLKKQNDINNKLLQILFHHKGIKSIKLLLQFITNNDNQKSSIALYLLSVLLTKYECNDYENQIYEIFAVIFFHLNNKNKSIRFSAIECMKSIKIENKSNDSMNQIMRLINEINNYSHDIMEDDQTLNRMLCTNSLQLSFTDTILPIIKLFVDNKFIHYSMLKLFVPIIIENKTKENAAKIHEITQNICKYLTDNNQSTNCQKCMIEIGKLLTDRNYYGNNINLTEFNYINKWIVDYQRINILQLIDNEYWTNLNLTQQQRLYLNLEKLFTKSNVKSKQQQIVNLILRVEFKSNLMQYLLDVNDVKDLSESKLINLMTRIQFFISKINNKTITKISVIPIMKLLKHIHLKMDNISEQIQREKKEAEIENKDKMNIDDLDNVDIDEFMVIDNEQNNENNNNNKENEASEVLSSSEQILETINWLRSIVLSLLIDVMNNFGNKLNEKEFNIEILISCMKYEWLFLNNNLLIQLICLIGKFIPNLLLKIYDPFIKFITNNVEQNQIQNKVILLSLLIEFFETTICFISPLIKTEIELRNIIQVSVSLFTKFNDNRLELQFLSLLAKSLTINHSNAIYIIFDICNKSLSSFDLFNKLLINSTNNNIESQLIVLSNIIDIVINNKNNDNDQQIFFLQIIANHLNHSLFIKEFSTKILENNDKIPTNIDETTCKMFKDLFNLFISTNNKNMALIIDDCLDCLRGFLSLKSFVSVIKDLILFKNNNKKHTLKCLQLIKDQIHGKSEKFRLNDANHFLKEIMVLLHNKILFKTNNDEIDEMIIFIFDKTIKKLNKFPIINEWYLKNIESFIISFEKSQSIIQSHLLLLFSTMIKILNHSSIILNNFGKILKFCINVLNQKKEKEDELLIISALFCLETSLKQYTNYIGPYLNDILKCILTQSLLKYLSVKTLSLYLNEIISSISKFNNCSKLIKSLKTVFKDKVIINKTENGAIPIIVFETYFDIICKMINLWKSRNETIENYLNLFNLLKYCMDLRILLRTKDSESPLKDINKYEFVILDCFSCLVLKLTDKEMVDIMQKLLYWIEEFDKSSQKYNIRTLMFFRFLCHCLNKFKSTFVKMGLFAFGKAINCLQSEHFDLLSIPPNKKQRINDDGLSKITSNHIIDNEDHKLILIQRSNYIMETIKLTLKFGAKIDQKQTSQREKKLIDKSTYLMLMPVFMDQIKYGIKLRNNSLEFVSYFEKYLTPTIIALANTTKDVSLWNELNGRLLSLSGNKNNLIRSAAVDGLLGLFNFMGHAWLNCLPQTLHSINELLQDNDDDVLQRTKDLVERIEFLTSSKINNLF